MSAVPTELRRYHIPTVDGLEGWAIIVIGSDGYFSTVSDFGCYAFKWNAFGERDFREFLLGIGPDYLVSKIAPAREFDGAATYVAVTKAIADADVIEDEAVRAKERRLLKEFASGECLESHDFARWLDRTNLSEAWEYACQRPNRDATAFAERVMPRFKELLRKEQEGVQK